MSATHINVEYCGAWGYAPKAAKVKQALVEKYGNSVDVTLRVGRRSSFEITMGDHLIFSKLNSGGFPEAEPLMQAIDSCMNGNMVSSEKTARSCVIIGRFLTKTWKGIEVRIQTVSMRQKPKKTRGKTL